MNNIFICGFMGCGKTTYGEKLANTKNKRFVDLDQYIEQKENMSIPLIFSSFSENYFREKEHFYLAELCQLNDCIISTGGGIFTYSKNYELIKREKSNIILYLAVDFDTCYNRIFQDKNRPLSIKPYEQLLELYNNRKIIYEKYADQIIEN